MRSVTVAGLLVLAGLAAPAQAASAALSADVLDEAVSTVRDPTPEVTTATSDTPPRAVTDLLEVGLDPALRELPGTELGDLLAVDGELTAGPPRPVWEFNEVRPGSRGEAPVALTTGRWTATLVASGKPVGRVEVATDANGRARVVDVEDDPSVARDLQAVPGGSPLVLDPDVDGWFTLEDDRVRAVDARARDQLAGSIDADQYLALAAARGGATTSPEPADVADVRVVPLAAGGGVVLVLLATAAVVWLRRPDAPEDEPRPPRGMLALRRPRTRETPGPAGSGDD